MPVEAPSLFIERAMDFYGPGLLAEVVAAANDALTESPATVTSWARSPTQNLSVGGAQRSQHLLGLAFDAVAQNPDQLAALLWRAGFTVTTYPTHLHAQAFPAGTVDWLVDLLGLTVDFRQMVAT